MKLLLAIAAGGALGSVLRYALGTAADRMVPVNFPHGTLLVNVLGSFAVGLAYVWLVQRSGASAELRAFVIIGVLGGFTTFSSFSLETVTLATQGSFGRAALNVTLSVVLCLLGTALGIAMARQT